MIQGPGLHPYGAALLGRPRGHVLRKADCLVSRGPLGDWCTSGRDEGPTSSAPGSLGLLKDCEDGFAA